MHAATAWWLGGHELRMAGMTTSPRVAAQLDLGFNQIGDAGALEFSKVLAVHNRTLTKVCCVVVSDGWCLWCPRGDFAGDGQRGACPMATTVLGDFSARRSFISTSIRSAMRAPRISRRL